MRRLRRVGKEVEHMSETKTVEFTTTREELWQQLLACVPSHFTVTEGEHGPGRKYHMTVGDLMDAFWAFCDRKEAGIR
jgi:hypothetical protein